MGPRALSCHACRDMGPRGLKGRYLPKLCLSIVTKMTKTALLYIEFIEMHLNIRIGFVY